MSAMPAVSPRRTLITGASKPLGIELVRQSLMRGDMVFAACRSPAKVAQLADLRARFGGLELLSLDPADAASVAEVVPVLEQLTDAIDLLVMAPAEIGPHERPAQIMRDEDLATLTGTGLVEHYRRHAVAPLLLIRTLLPWLTHGDGARVMIVNAARSTSGGGRAGGYASAASAAALQMHVRSLASDLRAERIVLCVGNPGRIRDSVESGDDGPSPIEEVALGLLTQMELLDKERSGSFVDWTGAARGL